MKFFLANILSFLCLWGVLTLTMGVTLPLAYKLKFARPLEALVVLAIWVAYSRLALLFFNRVLFIRPSLLKSWRVDDFTWAWFVASVIGVFVGFALAPNPHEFGLWVGWLVVAGTSAALGQLGGALSALASGKR
jgi:hypothetical protein